MTHSESEDRMPGVQARSSVYPMVVKPFWEFCQSGINPSPSRDFLLSLKADPGYILTNADRGLTGLTQIPMLSSDEIQPNQVKGIQTSEARPVISNACSVKHFAKEGHPCILTYAYTHRNVCGYIVVFDLHL